MTSQWVVSRNLYYAEIAGKGCTICKKGNLEEELCFNCKDLSECINCCGCEEEE